MKFKGIVYVCSPYAAETAEEREHNISVARTICRFALDQGYVPYAPHIFFPAVFANGTDGAESEDECTRCLGMEAGREMLVFCDELWVLKGRISSGMREEIRDAKEFDLPVKMIEVKEGTEIKAERGEYTKKMMESDILDLLDTICSSVEGIVSVLNQGAINEVEDEEADDEKEIREAVDAAWATMNAPHCMVDEAVRRALDYMNRNKEANND